jgi:hypothetical protein
LSGGHAQAPDANHHLDQKPSSGQVRIKGVDITKARRSIPKSCSSMSLPRDVEGETMQDFSAAFARAKAYAQSPCEGQVVELLQWFDGFDDDHPFAKVPFFEGVAGRPKPWILGSSPSSAVVAARLGLAYCFVAFLNPAVAQISWRPIAGGSDCRRCARVWQSHTRCSA